ncbi:hypothetical protein F6W69_18705 [Microbacterium oxydans]|uniref:hypothetical protein n=1 Tax=Microbacterium oxydans TaxID=82380 RepID=UPI001142CDEF|nr:hypothetical protein [Microbacterium oxydans]KAB1888786.1 hypothetical protein F6W69_18705 [Microbacterium oxydans]GED40602.1 hypothetical protein MOX01_37440 [Microbacterium oxydans]
MKAIRTIAGITAAGVLALGLLTACTPTAEPTPKPTESSTSSPTPTPTQTAATEPASDTDAIAAGYATAQEYFRIWDEIRNEHPEDAALIDTIAVDSAAEAARRSIASAAEKSIKSKGNVKFTLLEGQSYAAPARANGVTESEFGQPILYGCLDYSGLTGTDANGQAITPGAPVKVEVVARFVKAESRWIVISYTQDPGSTECAK